MQYKVSSQMEHFSPLFSYRFTTNVFPIKSAGESLIYIIATG